MTILRCYVDDRTLRILEEEARISGRKIEELAEAAISEAAIQANNSRPTQNQETQHE